MLKLLRIRNFAIIDEVELEFSRGFNAITGETGAGKSIILDAISLILGNRANADIIRAGENEAAVEAVFEFAGGEELMERLKSYGISTESLEHDFELIIKRVVNRAGKSRAYVNGDIVTLAQLADVCENLVDLCSQHEHQSLAKPVFQIELLDRYGGLNTLRDKVADHYSAVSSIDHEMDALGRSEAELKRSEDFLRFQLQEIEEFNPQAGEEDALTAEKKKLTFATQLGEWVSQSVALMNGADSEPGVLDLLGRASQKLGRAVEVDASLAAIAETLQQGTTFLTEAQSQLERYADSIELDPTRLEAVEDRLAAWSLLKKKYGASADEILATRAKLQADFSGIADRQKRLEELASLKEEAKKTYFAAASELSKKRKNVAKTLTASIQKELSELMMPQTVFKVDFVPLPAGEMAEGGTDRVQFLFSANPGEEPKPVSKIASGGELSRILLSIRRTIADRGGIGVYLFDEIDSGIGGQTASIVGSKLKSVAKHNQVICITHLPQVAAFAESHFVVSKDVAKGRTKSSIDRLEVPKRVEEIARMLGGLNISEKSRANAKELLQQANSL